jgi:hypothetical protein
MSWLKVGIKSYDRKYLRDQKLMKFFIEIKNKIQDILWRLKIYLLFFSIFVMSYIDSNPTICS